MVNPSLLKRHNHFIMTRFHLSFNSHWSAPTYRAHQMECEIWSTYFTCKNTPYWFLQKLKPCFNCRTWCETTLHIYQQIYKNLPYLPFWPRLKQRKNMIIFKTKLKLIIMSFETITYVLRHAHCSSFKRKSSILGNILKSIKSDY